MILLTVGTQMPFDRLVEIVDQIAAGFDEPFIAQIGRGAYIPRHMEWKGLIEPVEFEQLMEEARLVVSHAGIGTIVTAQRHAKPLVLFPRLASLNEHRNDHQLATTAALSGRSGIAIATTKEMLRACIDAPPAAFAVTNMHDRQRQLCETVSRFVAMHCVRGKAL
ncbi:glycosyltransferase [Novosphingobium album (ex Liu et al. 2023)]|uniref:Glycosyltransferase n=1 Tax=Novosphingobium album (ex Liu et al. 2023) TaxID=3031130 RepID=A0ABT5WQI3_9SPHN|nr:glycosyltransferase [Novosphingobium album (ex Liu et al. 2023)]MDE8652298.1 glycosyltransferase [Novosphingobium album (ex Liu et al. 2023)]